MRASRRFVAIGFATAAVCMWLAVASIAAARTTSNFGRPAVSGSGYRAARL